MNNSGIRTGDLWRYSALALPVAFAGFPLYVLAPDYYATTHSVSLSLLGMLLLGLRLFDALVDPLIGTLSDRYRQHSNWFMGIACVVLCISIYGLFNLSPISPALWFCICITVAVTAYSILSINLAALGGLWTTHPESQTRITTVREASGLIGIIIAVSLPSILKKFLPEQQAYVYFCLTLIALMVVAWIAFMPWLKRNTKQNIIAEKHSYSVISGIKSTSPLTRHFLLIYSLSMLASSIPAVLVIFFVRDLLGAESMTGVFLLLYFLSGAVAMPLWRKASASFSMYRAWILGMLLAISSFIWAFFLGAGDTLQYAAICIFSGIALGADLALPPAILAAHIHQNKNESHAATHYALLAFAAKLSLAMASAIALPLLGKAGFVPAAQNSEDALFFLSAGYALIPCLLKLGAALLLWRFTNYISNGESREKSKTNLHAWSSNNA